MKFFNIGLKINNKYILNKFDNPLFGNFYIHFHRHIVIVSHLCSTYVKIDTHKTYGHSPKNFNIEETEKRHIS